MSDAGRPDGSPDVRRVEAHVAGQLLASADLARTTAETLSEPIARFASLVLETLESGGKLLLCGNGGSAADAQHLAAEYVVRFRHERAALPAIALTTDTSVLTAGGNDLGFEKVFSRQVEAIGRTGDLLILHSTSGNSRNLIEAAAVARERGLRTAALLAAGGGALRERVDLAIVLPTESVSRAQEVQLAIGHAIADWVDARWSSEHPRDAEAP